MRDRESYLTEARSIGQQAALLVGFMTLLGLIHVLSGAMSGSTQQAAHSVLWLGVALALVLPVTKVLFDIRRQVGLDYRLYVALAGAAMLWVPIYLLAMFGDDLPDGVMALTDVGVGLLVGATLWRLVRRP